MGYANEPELITLVIERPRMHCLGVIRNCSFLRLPNTILLIIIALNARTLIKLGTCPRETQANAKGMKINILINHALIVQAP